MKRQYAVIYEKASSNWSAYVPDLPGCIAVGDTREDCEKSMREAIEFHIEGMTIEGFPIPEPTTVSGMVEVAVA